MRRFMVAAMPLLAIIVLFIPMAGAVGAAGRQNVTGTVKDALGRPLADVQLVLETGEGQILMRTRSGQGGFFEFRDLPNGTYEIVANKKGFRTGVAIAAFGWA